jgi:hypothetical protein
MGMPYFFSGHPTEAVFLGGNIAEDMTDAQISALFESSSVFLDGDCALTLCERGYSDLLGVDVTDEEIGRISGEYFGNEKYLCCTKQKRGKKLTPKYSSVEELSFNYRKVGADKKPISPAVTCYRRPGGALSVVFCGSPNTTSSYMEGFAFLNESRKNQLTKLLLEAGALPVYLVGDGEVSVRAGYLPDGALLVALNEIGIDPMDDFVLYLKEAPGTVERIKPDGGLEAVEFSALGDGKYQICAKLEAMYPVFLIIKPK